LPIGWGSIPWGQLIERVRFHPGVIFNIELEHSYWSEVENTITAVRDFAARAKTTG